MAVFLILAIALILRIAADGSDYAAAGKFLEQQKQFNLAMHRKNLAMINEKTRLMYKDDPDPMKVYKMIGGMVVDKDKPVHIPEVHMEDYFK